MLRQNTLEKIMDYIMSHGGDFAEIYGEYTVRNQIIMSGSQIAEASSGTDAGVGIHKPGVCKCVGSVSICRRIGGVWKITVVIPVMHF